MAVTRNDPRAAAPPAPPLVGTIHEGIPVRDLDASLKFYVDVLGLQPLPRPKLPVPGAWLGRPLGGSEADGSIPLVRRKRPSHGV